MKIIPSSVWQIARAAFLVSLPLYAVLTVANFIRFAPQGIFAKTMGIGSSYRTNVGELFGEGQNMVLPIAVLAACIIVSAAYISDSSED